MMSHRLKDYRNSYREWRRHPVKYEYPGEKHRCSCCGEEHEGNFCPLCGQKATHGPVTWKSVQAGIMEIWGLHSRSLPYTAWQLLFRPGHLIRDYITGKRQGSFPPVKMLVLMGVIVYLLGHWLLPKKYSHEIAEITSTGTLYYVSYAWNWLQAHGEWLTLVVFSTFILPTWIVFRHAPLLKRHTLPQGFFIQVFIANQSLVVEFIMLLLSMVLFFVPYSNLKIVIALLFVVYLYVDYKQLFGYNWWGTVWRMFMILVIILMVLVNVGTTISMIYLNQKKGVSITLGMIAAFIFIGCIIGLVIYCIDIINRKTWRERGKWKAWRLPIMFGGILLLLLIVVIILSLL